MRHYSWLGYSQLSQPFSLIKVLYPDVFPALLRIYFLPQSLLFLTQTECR